jgi:hypothetical protein
MTIFIGNFTSTVKVEMGGGGLKVRKKCHVLFEWPLIANFYPVFGGVRTHDLSVTSVNQEQLDLRRFKFDVQITFLLFVFCRCLWRILT